MKWREELRVGSSKQEANTLLLENLVEQLPMLGATVERKIIEMKERRKGILEEAMVSKKIWKR